MGDSSSSTTTFVVLAAAGLTCAVQAGLLVALYRKCAALSKRLVDAQQEQTQNTQLIRALRTEIATLRQLVKQLEQQQKQQQTTSNSRAVVANGQQKLNIARTESMASGGTSESEDYADAVEELPTPATGLLSGNRDKNNAKMTNGPTTAAAATPSTTKITISDHDQTQQQRHALLEHIDRLHETGKHEQAYEELIKIDKETDSELLWRFARASHQVANGLEVKNPKRKQLLDEAHRHASRAHQLVGDADFNVLKWMAAVIGSRSDHLGTKERIEQGILFKQYLDKALAMKPEECALLHMRGRFAFSVASLSWFERKAAATLFATPPEASFEDAIRDFSAAERLQPWWLDNLVYLAKALLAVGDKQGAVARLEKAVDEGEEHAEHRAEGTGTGRNRGGGGRGRGAGGT